MDITTQGNLPLSGSRWYPSSRAYHRDVIDSNPTSVTFTGNGLDPSDQTEHIVGVSAWHDWVRSTKATHRNLPDPGSLWYCSDGSTIRVRLVCRADRQWFIEPTTALGGELNHRMGRLSPQSWHDLVDLRSAMELKSPPIGSAWTLEGTLVNVKAVDPVALAVHFRKVDSSCPTFCKTCNQQIALREWCLIAKPFRRDANPAPEIGSLWDMGDNVGVVRVMALLPGQRVQFASFIGDGVMMPMECSIESWHKRARSVPVDIVLSRLSSLEKRLATSGKVLRDMEDFVKKAIAEGGHRS